MRATPLVTRSERLLAQQRRQEVRPAKKRKSKSAPHRYVFLGLMLFIIVGTTYELPLAEVSIGGAAAFLFLAVAFNKRPFTLGGRPGQLLLLYAFLVALSVPTSIWLGPSIEATRQLAELMLLFVVARNALLTRQRVWWFVTVMVLCITLYPGLGSIGRYLAGTTAEAGRAQWRGLYGNSNMMALTALMHLPFAAVLFSLRRSVLWKLLWGAVVVVLLVVAVLTKSRAGFLALLMLGTGAILVSNRRALLLGLVAAGGIGLAILAPDDFKERVSTIFESPANRDYSARSRMIIWGTAIEIAMDHPLTGAGVGTYERANAEYAPLELGKAGGQRYIDTHSTFLNIWAEIGTPGLIVFVAALWTLLAHSWRTLKSVPDPRDPLARLLRAGVVSMLVFVVMAVFNTFHNTWFFYTTFAAMLAMNKLLQDWRDGRVPAVKPLRDDLKQRIFRATATG